MSPLRSLLALAALPLLATACTPQACDPSQAGFFSGIGCQASGSFDQRNLAQRQQLSSARDEAMRQDANASYAQQDAANAQLSLAERRRRVAGLDSQIDRARRQLATLRTSQGVDQARLARAQQAVQQAQQDRSQLSPNASGPQIDQQQRRLADILRDM